MCAHGKALLELRSAASFTAENERAEMPKMGAMVGDSQKRYG